MECRISGERLIPKSLLKQFLTRVNKVSQARVFKRHGFDEVSLSFVRDLAIQKLNRTYRGKDKPTDVLSFAHDDDQFVGSRSIGDIVISVDTAKRQAREFKVSLLDELTRLFIHGMLHCAGYDHENVSRRTAIKMFSTQSYLMKRALAPALNSRRKRRVQRKKPRRSSS